MGTLPDRSQVVLPAMFELEGLRRESRTGPANLALLLRMSILSEDRTRARKVCREAARTSVRSDSMEEEGRVNHPAQRAGH